jgi:hypothetical protein
MSAAAAKRKEEVGKTSAQKEPRASQSKPTANGLWVNWEFLRSLSKRAPETLVHREDPADYNRILKLADVALDNTVERRHAEKRTLAFAKKQESKKHKAG